MSFRIGAPLASSAMIKSRTRRLQMQSENFPRNRDLGATLIMYPHIPLRNTVCYEPVFKPPPANVAGNAKWYPVDQLCSKPCHAINNLQVEIRR